MSSFLHNNTSILSTATSNWEGVSTYQDDDAVGKVYSGAEAATYVAYAFSDILIDQPFTRQEKSAQAGSVANDWSKNNRLNVNGNVTDVHSLGKNEANGSGLTKLSENGKVVSVVTGSPFLRQMLPNLYQVAAEGIPTVIHCAAFSLDPSSGVARADLSDIALVRESGFALLSASTVQEAHDMAIVAQIAASASRTPFVHFFDGSRVAGEVSRTKLLGYNTMSSKLDFAMEHEEVPAVVEQVMNHLEHNLGRKYGIFEYVGPADAESVVVTLGVTGTVFQEVISSLDKSIGLLKVRLLRPFCNKKFLANLPSTTKKVCVIDQTSTPGKGPLFQDVAAAFHSDAQMVPPTLVSANVLNGVTQGQAFHIVHEFLSNPKANIAVGSSDFENTSELVSSTILWSMRDQTNASRPRVCAQVLGPRLSLHVQQYDQFDVVNTSFLRSEIRFAPISITAEYPVENADLVVCDNASVLLLPQYNVIDQVKKNGTLVINSSWSLKDMEHTLSDKVKHDIAAKSLKVFVIDAAHIASHAGVPTGSSWILEACILYVCGQNNNSMSFNQALPHLQRLLKRELKSTAAALLSPHLSEDALVASLAAISYPAENWLHAPLSHAGEHVEKAHLQPTALESIELAANLDGKTRKTYSEILEQLFSDRLIVADTNVGSSSSEASLESYYGEFLAKAQARRRLVQHVGEALNSDMSAELKNLLKQWYHGHQSVSVCNSVVPKLKPLLKSAKNQSPELQYIYEHESLLLKSSKWILGGDKWAYDLASSGIHHILASGDDINVLVLDTKQYSQNHETPVGAKKDIGLYAMSYGGAYVASVSILASHTQTLRAISEADAFNGPSIVLAHAPIVDPDAATPTAIDTSVIDELNDFVEEVAIVTTPLEEAQVSVESGRWPLYRWNPSLEKLGKDPFVLDSSKLREEVEQFLNKEQQLTLLANKEMKLPGELRDSLESKLATQSKALKEQAERKRLLAEQFDSLANGVSNPQLNLLVLYGSDSGHAAGVAENIAKKAEASKCGEVRVMEANQFNLDELSEEKHVVLVLATAGQGEDCANAKNFTDTLHKSKSKLPGLKFAVFGLGDSHYWGAGSADSAKYFCLPARMVHEQMVKLGATPIVEAGLGDDQHDDGYDGAYSEWEPKFWESLEVTPVKGKIAGGAPEIVDDDIKTKSNFLRGMIDEGLKDMTTGKLLPEDTKLTKFHGIYQQDLRTVREELDNAGLERAYSFMIRIGVPGGVATSEQYIAMDELCSTYANGALKLTTRQAYQLHGVVKKNLKTTMQGINKACMDTLAACGDVNRNVIGNPHVRKSKAHAEVNKLSNALNVHLKPRTSAYHEIWLDKKRVGGSSDYEPIYGVTYLPRKFKIAIAVPPCNDVDVFAHCLGFIAICNSRGELEGWNITIGGGMGTTHGNKATYPRLSELLGFCTTEQCVKVAESIVLLQRDHGERVNRKHARLKYTVEDLGIPFFRENVEKMCGFKLGAARPFHFTTNSDPYGWNKGIDGKWDYTMYVENGYIKDQGDYPIKTALREIAEFHTGGEFSLTANQNIIIGAVSEERKPQIQQLLNKYNIDNSRYSAMRLHSMACVALPTCALAMAESQTYLPSLVGKLEETLDEAGLRHDAITIRMTGCPNGCARPYIAEIAFVGKAPGNYNLYLGAGHAGNRINKMYKEGVNEEQILEILRPMLKRYAVERHNGERFGDWVIRAGIIEPTVEGKYFWSYGSENKTETPSGTLQIYW